jgi:F0F1-type ATP synthase, subunit b
MTLQISVIIWTVICFAVLALVLNHFLFKPLLKVMDSRNRRIEGEMAERKAELDRREKRKLDAQLEREAAQKKVMEDNERAIEEARTATAERIAAEKSPSGCRGRDNYCCIATGIGRA